MCCMLRMRAFLSSLPSLCSLNLSRSHIAFRSFSNVCVCMCYCYCYNFCCLSSSRNFPFLMCFFPFVFSSLLFLHPNFCVMLFPSFCYFATAQLLSLLLSYIVSNNIFLFSFTSIRVRTPSPTQPCIHSRQFFTLR